jgi:hypothetical protein
MLVKLLPDQIARYWELIRWGLTEGGREDLLAKKDKLNNILEALLVDRMQCWWYVIDDGEKDSKVISSVITSTQYDYTEKRENLCIFSVFGFEDIDKSWWHDGMQTIENYARGRGYGKLVGYTDNVFLIRLARARGWDCRLTYVEKEL